MLLDAKPARRRLQAVLLDELRTAREKPLHLPAPADTRLQQVAELLERDLSEPRSLEQLADLVGTSAQTLSRLCRDELGMTLPQWRTQIRLHYALRLLADGHPVTSVAIKCGWATPSAFIDVYRRNFGYTPGARRPRRR
jgi:transcriptional regulator GlxA family with amidase domain